MSEAVQKYSKPAIILHWLTALVMLALFVLGWYMVGLPQKAPKATTLDLFDLGVYTMQFSEAISVRTFYFNLHKSLGITLLVILALRLIVRLREVVPAFPQSMQAWEIRIADLTHRLLYALMVIVPLFGFGTALYSKFGIKWFGLTLFDGLDDAALRDVYRVLHEIGGWILFVLIVLHVAAALKHKFVDKDQVMQRILP